MIDDLPPLREVIARDQLAAHRSLGQNFILDLNLTMRIARAAGDLHDATVIEIGPGPGGLTRALLAAGARRVIAIERDDRCLPALAEIGARYPGRLEIVSADARRIDYGAIAGPTTRIVANLPYNIATPLLVAWLKAEPWPPFYRSLTLMFQREVAERITAPPRSRSYGRLAVLAGWRTHAAIVMDLPPRAFTPPPKVSSSVVHMVPKPAATACNPLVLERVTAAAFGQRRKMLRQSLRTLGIDPQPVLAATGVAGTMRPQDLDVETFVALANAYGDGVRDGTSNTAPPISGSATITTR